VSGVGLILNHPRVAYRDCDHCQKYLYDEDTGLVELGRDGQPEMRYDACPPRCRLPVDERGRSLCPKGTPENPRSLLPIMEQCYQHYRECRAVGSFPDDPLVRRNAAAIRDVEEVAEQNRQSEFQSVLASLAIRGATR
jgi:hypothetical protein